MRTPAQRGRYGQWLVASRVARGYDTAEKALRAMAAAGISIAKSTYAEYEAGSKPPSRNHLPLLEGFWGPAPAVDALGAGDQAELVAAIRDLVEELRLTRESQASHQRAEIAEAVREAVQPLWELVRDATRPRAEPAPGEATHGERR